MHYIVNKVLLTLFIVIVPPTAPPNAKYLNLRAPRIILKYKFNKHYLYS